MNDRLYQKVRRLGVEICHVAEVGVYHPETSQLLGFIRDGIRTDLFEPDPESLAKIQVAFGGLEHVTVYPYAIYKEAGRLTLYRAGASTFAAELESSPALANDGYQPSADQAFEVEARRFSEFDDSSIDLLSIDTEGCDWYVLMHLKSRPKVISVETGWKRYRNPFLSHIRDWADTNGYRVWYRDRSDTVYLRRDVQLGFLRRWCDRWWP
jgi:FkbM family methyltransferase